MVACYFMMLYRLVWPWMAIAVPMKKSTFRWPNIKFHIWFLRRILRQIQNRVRQNFISSRKLSFKRENGFLVDKKFCRTQKWIRHKKLLLLAAWVLSRLENWASHLVSKKHVEVPRNYYADIIIGKTAEGDDFFDYARLIKKIIGPQALYKFVYRYS